MVKQKKDEGVIFDSMFCEEIKNHLMWVRVIVQKPPHGIAGEPEENELTLEEQIGIEFATIRALMLDTLNPLFGYPPTVFCPKPILEETRQSDQSPKNASA